MKTERIRDEKFRRWIASLPCMVCGQALISQAAHIEKGGIGLKSSDESCRPLCADTPNRQGCHAKVDQSIIKLPWELRRDIIEAPVYKFWKQGDKSRAIYHIQKFRTKLNDISDNQRTS